jgi:transcriptional regulator with XRE-family HTH domain
MGTRSTVRLRLREARQAAGLTQAELAERADLRRATIADIEAGKTTGIDFDTLARLGDALGVNAALLIEHSTKRR